MTKKSLETEQIEYTVTLSVDECSRLINLCNNCTILANTLKNFDHVLAENKLIVQYPNFLNAFITFLREHRNDLLRSDVSAIGQLRLLKAAKAVNLFLETLSDKFRLLRLINSHAKQLSKLLNKKRIVSKAARHRDELDVIVDVDHKGTV